MATESNLVHGLESLWIEWTNLYGYEDDDDRYNYFFLGTSNLLKIIDR